MDVFYAMYNMICFFINEELLLDTCLVYLSLPLDWVEPYLDIHHNNVIHISGETAHDVKKDR